MRRTKIVCTIGPATSSPHMLEGLLRAGMDVARLNFSHGTHEQHAAVIARLRDLADRWGRALAILQDLSGPKVRLGSIAAGTVALKRGQRIVLTTRNVPGDCEAVPLPVPELVAAVQPGDRLLADDGNVELAVIARSDTDLTVRAISPGILSSHKGITAPGVELPLKAVTPKDLDDLRFGLAQGVDWVAASYLCGPEDLAPLRAVMEETGICRPLIAKIEKREAVRRIEEIVAAAEGVMVARGDLGVEIPIDEVPIVQKRIIALCNRAGKPVITATQMLDSMMHHPRPTRAEVTDVANAILDGTDAVMLSGETAAGDYPLEAVRMMAKVAVRADACLPDRPAFGGRHDGPMDVAGVVARAAVEMARALNAKAILCATTSGSTARQIARFRPDTPVIGATPHQETFRRLALTWGVRPLLIRPVADTDQMMEETITAVVEQRIVRSGDRVILTAGVPVNAAGRTNLIRVHVVGDSLEGHAPRAR
jgi:pyruvate kinase